MDKFTLNELIEYCNDTRREFEEGIEGLEPPELSEHSRRLVNIYSQLEDELRKLKNREDELLNALVAAVKLVEQWHNMGG